MPSATATNAQVYFTVGEMRAMGLDIPTQFSIYAKGGTRRGWKVRSRPAPGRRGGGAHGARRYQLEDVKRMLASLAGHYSAYESFVDDDQETWSPAPLLQKAKRFPKTTLRNWHESEAGCPLLDGKQLGRRVELARCKDGIIRWTAFYRESELEKIKTVRTALLRPDRLGLSEAMEKLDLSQWVIKSAVKEPHPRLNGTVLRKLKRSISTKTHSGGITIQARPTYDKSQLEALAGKTVEGDAFPVQSLARPDPTVWANEEEARTVLGVTSSVLLNRYSIVGERPNFPKRLARKKQKRGYVAPAGQRLTVRTRWVREERMGHLRYVLYYFVEDIKAIATARAKAADTAAEPYIDSDGRWHRLIRFPKTHNVSYRSVRARMEARKPADGWKTKRVPSVGRQTLAVHEDDLSLLLADVSPSRDPATKRFTPRALPTRPAAPAFGTTSSPAPSQSRVRRKRGRRLVQKDLETYRLRVIAEWEQFRDSGSGTKEHFCMGKEFTAKDLDRWLSWRTMRNGPSRL